MQKNNTAPAEKDLWLERVQELRKKYDMDIDEYPQRLISKFGGEVMLRSQQGWLPEVVVYSPGKGNLRLRWGEEIHSHPVIEHSARYYLMHCLRTRAGLNGANMLVEAIKDICIGENEKEENAYIAIYKWIESKIAQTKYVCEPLYSCVREYVGFCLECETWGFEEPMLFALEKHERSVKHAKKSKLYRVGILDAVEGPYSQEEMQRISSAIHESNGLLVNDKAMILLCREYGIRPIQIALLRRDDLVRDVRGTRLRIPRVKGRERSGLRRSSGNFTERPVSEELEVALNESILENDKKIGSLDIALRKLCEDEGIHFVQPPIPLFPREVVTDICWDIYRQDRMRQYAYHRTNGSICASIREITGRLNITDNRYSDSGGRLEISAYRFRRTKATSMVIQGYSPEDVAYALDHASLSAVQHYFRFSRDLIDYVNTVTDSSDEIRALASYWEGRFLEGRRPGSQEVRVNKLESLGLCLSQHDCEHHPTVSCYSCPSFRPYRDGSHQAALENIVKIRNEIGEKSSGPIRAQLDLAIEMAKQCVSAQEVGFENG